MSSLFASLNTASEALQAFQSAIDVTQNNVNNASTPGYASQTPVFIAQPFDIPSGLIGGVKAGIPQDTRNSFAEQSVRNQQSGLGLYSQLATSLAPLQNSFDATGSSGISAALNSLFQSFSSWATSPQQPAAQQAVLTAAQQVATSFQQASNQVTSVRQGVDQDLSSTVTQINSLAAQIQQYNVQQGQGSASNSGLQAGLYQNLESLSQLANIVPIFQKDGTVTVLLGGQTPLVIGQQANPIQLSYANSSSSSTTSGAPDAKILAADGTDVTSQITQGSLGALLQVRNTEIPSLIGDGQQAGSLNVLAKSLADRINQILTAGQISSSPAQSGVPLFTYNASASAGVAGTLAVSSTITGSQLAAIDPGPPAVSNGTALTLANLPQSTAAADQIQGLSFTDFFSSLATQVGQAVSDAQNNQTTATNQAAQAKSLRDQLSGVSLDQEATNLVTLQRSYQAAAQMVTIINSLAQSVISMVS